MVKKITVELDKENMKKLRIIQSKKIRESDQYISFSRVLNDIFFF